jgi:hypothetical protein
MPGRCAMNKAYGTVLHGEVKLDHPVEWADGTRVEVFAHEPSSTNGNGSHPAAGSTAGVPSRTGVRAEFLTALNNNEYGQHAEELWPLSPEETELLIAHMDARPPTSMSDEEYEAFQEFLRTSKAEQKELVRKSWDFYDTLFQ